METLSLALHNSGLYRTALQLEKVNVRECDPDVTAKEIKIHSGRGSVGNASCSFLLDLGESIRFDLQRGKSFQERDTEIA